MLENMDEKYAGIAIPATADEITAEWLTEALQRHHRGADVSSVEVVHTSEVTNAHARLAVTYREAAGAPGSLFCKLLPTGERRALIANTRMGPREVRFYDDLAPKLSLRVPAVHVALHDPSDESFVLLMEDLLASGCEVSDGTWGVDSDGAADALVGLAEVHARFEDPARRAADAPWVPEPTFGSTYGSVMLQYGLDNHRDRLSDDFAAISTRYIERGAVLFDLWTRGPKTIIHGDTHIGNVFFDHGRVGFLDWGIINVNTPMREVSYFLNMAMDIGERRAHQTDLIVHYLEARRAFGATEIGFDEAWRSHRIHAAYCVVASCQVVTFPEDASEWRRVFSDAFLSRAEAAIEDLEALRALDEEIFP
jgi:hypothetical protein